MVLKAIGQSFVARIVGRRCRRVRNGRIVVDADRRTSLPDVYAGGDCVAGADLTVTAVQDGKLAAAGDPSSTDRIKAGHAWPICTANFAGIRSPNPFWLASAPPTDKAYNVARAFKAGWGGVVWKTLGEDPPIVNVSSRYGGVSYNGARIAGFSNIELITDRPLQVNLDEIKQIKRDWPDRAVVVSLMVPCTEESWQRILARVEDTGCDGVELNFGCPHGMSERDMGSAVGQVPDYVEMVTRWCKQHTRMPVIVKLTPNVTDILAPAAAAQARRRGWRVADQYVAVDHRRRSGSDGAGARGGRPGHAWRLLRSGGEADRTAHGRRHRARHAGSAGVGDRRHLVLA